MTRPTRSFTTGLAAALREQTQVVHNQAETEPFVVALMRGELPISAYAGLVAQNYAIYSALEDAARNWLDDPIAGPFVLDELTRGPQLERDLAALFGPQWRRETEVARLPATERYVAHLTEVGADWPAGFVAHHYVRYLGDLSGGQVIRQRIAQIYGDQGRAASNFYAFERIEKIKPFRDRYREELDRIPIDVDEQRRVVAEAVRAFAFNRSVFAELGEQFAPIS